jgi:hypothetical protein
MVASFFWGLRVKKWMRKRNKAERAHSALQGKRGCVTAEARQAWLFMGSPRILLLSLGLAVAHRKNWGLCSTPPKNDFAVHDFAKPASPPRRSVLYSLVKPSQPGDEKNTFADCSASSGNTFSRARKPKSQPEECVVPLERSPRFYDGFRSVVRNFGSASRAMMVSCSSALRAVDMGLCSIESKFPRPILFTIPKSFSLHPCF